LLTVGDAAFSYCPFLAPISLPASVRTIGDDCFAGSDIAATRDIDPDALDDEPG
jgi:hypothetical protein